MAEALAWPEIEDIQRKIEQKISSASDIKQIATRFLNFYLQYRINETDVARDGDIFLFEWGTFDWGKGRYFEINLIRQVIKDTDDPTVALDSKKQLSVSYRYLPDEDNDGFRSGSRWCQSPTEIVGFHEWLLENEPFQWACNSVPEVIEVRLTRA